MVHEITEQTVREALAALNDLNISEGLSQRQQDARSELMRALQPQPVQMPVRAQAVAL